MDVFRCDTFCASAAWIYSVCSYKHIIILEAALGSFADKSYLWTWTWAVTAASGHVFQPICKQLSKMPKEISHGIMLIVFLFFFNVAISLDH